MLHFPTTRRPAPLVGLSISPARPRRCDAIFLLVGVTCLTVGGVLGFVVSSWLKLLGL